MFRVLLASLLFVTPVVYADDMVAMEQALQLYKQKQYSAAEKLLSQLHQQAPAELAYLNNLAVVQMAKGDVEQALQSLQKAVAANREFSTAQKNINDIYAFKASKAYALALDKKGETRTPELTLITELAKKVTPPAVSAENSQQQKAQAEAAEVPVKEPLDTVLKQQIESWANAWMQGDVTNYLARYSDTFVPENRQALNVWQDQRRYRLRNSKNVQLGYNKIRVFVSSDQGSAVTEFVQHYRSGSYQDKVVKQLVWVFENKQWRISREREIEKL